MKLEETERSLLDIPRVKIGFFPTPLQELNNLSRKYNINLYMKRDDLTGPGFGGNKIRKLEFLLADALGKKAEYIFTYGAHQTNHGRETVAACRKYGLKPILYLVYLGDAGKPQKYKGNLLLDKIMDAEIKYVSPAPGMSAYETVKESSKISAEHIKKLEKSGHKCYDIPIGGFNLIGCLGFVSGFIELMKQLQEKSIKLDYIFHATGTGGTLAGLLAGKKMLDSDIKIIPISVDSEPENKKKTIVNMANEILKALHVKKTILSTEINIDTNYYGEGYEIPTKKSTDAIKELAREEGIILDPVYTSKAMSGLLDYVRKGKIPKDSKVLFWHTGGTPAIFSEEEIVGKVYI